MQTLIPEPQTWPHPPQQSWPPCPLLPSSSPTDSPPPSQISPNLSSQIDDSADISFHDPVLHFIDGILMQDENLADQKCMIQQCILHHATMKELSDILRTGQSCSLCGQSSCQHESALSSSLREDQEHPVITEEVWNKEGQRTILPIHSFDGVSAFLESDSLAWPTNFDGNEPYTHIDDNDSQWMEDILNSMDDKPRIEYAASATLQACDFPEHGPLSPSSEGQSSSDRSSNSSSSSLQYPVPTSKGISDTRGNRSVSSSGIQNHTTDMLNEILEISQHSLEVESSNTDVKNTFSASQGWRHRSEEPARQRYSVPNSNNRSKSANGSHRSKRTALAMSEAQQLHGGVQDTLLAEESEISYVKNENLNAEMFAKPLLHGLDFVKACIKANLKNLKPASSLPSNGKNIRRLVTTTDLTSLLLSCAQAVGMANVRRAHEILKDIRQDASPYGNDLQRLAHYFAEGLVARLNGTGGQLYSSFRVNAPSAAKMLKAHHHFVEVCPIVKTSNYFSGSAIIKAAKKASRLHIVDYGISYGLQWPGVISALAEREGGPPYLRITGIDFPQPGENPSGRLEMTGHYLAEYAKAYNVPFEYRPIATEWENINASMLRLREDEVLVVNSIYRLRHLFDETVSQSNPRETVLKNIFDMKPKLFVQGVQNGNHSSPFFMSRFKDALTLYASSFDMFETIMSSDSQERMMIEREILGRDILNIVACEGPERVERPETYKQWQIRTQKAGFVQMPLEKKMTSDMSAIMKHKYNKNFSIDQDGGWMLLGWKGKVFNCLCVWKVGL